MSAFEAVVRDNSKRISVLPIDLGPISKFNTAVDSFEAMVLNTGTTSDNSEFRTNLYTLRDECNSYCEAITSKLTVAIRDANVMRTNKNQINRSRRQFDQIMSHYTAILSKLSSRDEAIIRHSSVEKRSDNVQENGDHINISEIAVTVSNPRQDYDNFTRLDADLLEERKNAMLEVARDAEAIKEIMKDVSMLVTEQQVSIDSLESGVDKSTMHIVAANKEIEKTINHSRTRRRRLCCLIFVILIMLGFVFGGALSGLFGRASSSGIGASSA